MTPSHAARARSSARSSAFNIRKLVHMGFDVVLDDVSLENELDAYRGLNACINWQHLIHPHLKPVLATHNTRMEEEVWPSLLEKLCGATLAQNPTSKPPLVVCMWRSLGGNTLAYTPDKAKQALGPCTSRIKGCPVVRCVHVSKQSPHSQRTSSSMTSPPPIGATGPARAPRESSLLLLLR